MLTLGALERAIKAAVEFIAINRSSDGLWRDFQTDAGASSDWVTAFVAYALGHVGHLNDAILDTLKLLLFRQRPNGGWSYNKTVPTDCDSTAWVLMSFSVAPAWKPSSVVRGIRYIKNHQDMTLGGFSTYSDQDHIDRFIGVTDSNLTEGWCYVHPCVTGVALQSLIAHGEQVHSCCIISATKYLLLERDTSGLWRSYWWKGYGYSTYDAMRALYMSRALNTDQASRTRFSLLIKQQKDGGWNDSSGQRSEVFATAFNVLSLLLLPDPITIQAADRGAAWLLRQQNSDGSWPTSPILRIPPPMVREPKDIEAWRTNQLGTGVIIEDGARIFTSAAALWSLSIFRSMID